MAREYARPLLLISGEGADDKVGIGRSGLAPPTSA
jgi:hypothetical protein